MSKQTSRRAGRSSSPSATRLLPPEGGAAIRMYRQGLGDCFLLAFDTGRRRDPAYLLIDCGAHAAQSGGRENMAKVVDDVIRATGGRLNVVVATHEHSDHLSAFTQQAARFLDGELAIDELWLAWTENDDDPEAHRLRQGRTAAQQAVEAALERLKQQAGEHPDASLVGRLAAAESFFQLAADGVGVGDTAGKGAKESSGENSDESGGTDRTITAMAERLGLRDPDKVTGNELAFALLKDRAGAVRYFRPGGAPVPLPGASAARAYMLGPPLDESLLKKSDPSSGSRQETYLAASSSAGALGAALAAASAGEGGGSSHGEAYFPFAADCRIGFEPAAASAFFRSLYPLSEGEHPLDWRAIENDWLQAAGELALDLDKHTNNTSLAIAFELGPPGDGPVLLFPADAQVGSWLSWKTVAWRVAGRNIGVDDLFRRTQVYKVGHHGSHNATLKRDESGADYGLEMMPQGVLALVPVDETVAHKLRGWDMPFPKLYQALKRKTCGNLLRSDDGHDDRLPVPRIRFDGVPGLPRVRWRRSRLQKAGGGPLYYDLAITSEE